MIYNFIEILKNIINYFFNLINNNIIISIVIIYIIFIIIYFYLFIPLIKKIIVKIVNSTKSNLDNELYWKTRIYLKLFWLFFWINLVFNVFNIWNLKSYLINNKFINFEIILNSLYTVELILLFFILKIWFNIIIKYFWKNKKEIFTKSLKKLLKIIWNILIFVIFSLIILKL